MDDTYLVHDGFSYNTHTHTHTHTLFLTHIGLYVGFMYATTSELFIFEI